MKVAVIGAGLAGLSCALELKRNGIIPVIFEKRSFIGHPLEHTITTFNLFNNSISDPLKKLKKSFDIELKPLYVLDELIMKGPTKVTKVNGKLGYVFKRGIEPYSMENQIHQLSNIPVEFDNFIDINNIKNSYDAIVVATGDDSIPRHMGLWWDQFSVYVRVATVLGSFKVGTMNVWINTEYSKSCYCYLLPNNPKEACMVFNINDTTGEEMEYYWKNFLYTEEIQYKIIETRDCLCNVGHPEILKTPDNIYFVGNSGGFMDDFLGFGILGAIESGVFAAKSIIKGKDYVKLTCKINNDIEKIHEYRQAFSTFDNNDIDRLLTMLDMTGIKQIIYRNGFIRAKNCSFLPKIYTKLKK